MKVKISNQYESEIIEGTGSEIIARLMQDALDKRKHSRGLMRDEYREDVQAILNPAHKHQSELVNLASFQVKRCGLNRLLILLNNHGVQTYEIV